MNRRPSVSMNLAKAISGFLQYKTAEGLSPNTLTNYQPDLKLLQEFAQDSVLNEIQPQQVREFFVWLRDEYKPHRFNGSTQLDFVHLKTPEW